MTVPAVFPLFLALTLSLAISAQAAAPVVKKTESPDGVFLVRAGQPTSAVILPDDAGAWLERIARQFTTTVERSTGAEIPVIRQQAAETLPNGTTRIFLGGHADVSAQGLPEEGYRLVCQAGTIIIAARDNFPANASSRPKPASRPTLWALNRILEEGLGVRWLWPGELGTFAPPAQDVFVPYQDVTHQPRLIQRNLRIALAYARANRGTEAHRQMEQEAIDWAENHQAGRRGNFKFGHAFGQWWEKFSATHPDYFMETPPGISLEKLPAKYIKLRLANPAVIDEIAREYTAAGAPRYWNVCPNDGSGFDVSAETRAWDIPQGESIQAIWSGKVNLTPRYVMFWNRVSERLKTINPDVILCSYAYSAYKTPPPKERPLTARMAIGLVLSYYDDAHWNGWAATGSELFLRPNWWHVGANAPYLPLEETAEFLRMAFATGLVGVDMDSVMGYWATQGLNYYLVARLMNQPELSLDDILREYTSAFGAGADTIRAYFAYWQKVTTEYRYLAPDGKFQDLLAAGKVDRVLTRASRHLLPLLYSDEVVAPARKLLDQATVQIPATDTEARARVEFLRRGLDEMTATRDLVALSQQIKTAPTAELKARFEEQSAALENLRSTLSPDHVIWGETITKDEDRRGVFFAPRFQAPKDETDEM